MAPPGAAPPAQRLLPPLPLLLLSALLLQSPEATASASALRRVGGARTSLATAASAASAAAATAIPTADELAAELQHAADAGARSFVIPRGDYVFEQRDLVVRGAAGLAVEGSGATLWFHCGFGMQLRDSRDSRVANLSIDYDPPCYAQGTILSVGRGDGGDSAAAPSASTPATVTVAEGTGGGAGARLVARFDAAFARPVKGVLPGSNVSVDSIMKVCFWDPAAPSFAMLRNHSVSFSAINNFLVNSSFVNSSFVNISALNNPAGNGSASGPSAFSSRMPDAAQQEGEEGKEEEEAAAATAAGWWDYELELAAPLDLARTPGVRAGTLITVHSRTDGGVYNGDGQAYLVFNCSRMVTEDVTIYAGGAMGFVEASGDGGNTYRRMLVTRRNRRGSDTLRLLSTNVDGMHSGQLRNGPLVEDSEIAWTGDDHGNVHDRIEIVVDRLNDTTLLMLDTELGHTLGADGFVGSTVEFRHLNTYAELGSAMVEAVTPAPFPGHATADEYSVNITATLNAAPYHGNIRLATVLPQLFTVRFAAPLPAGVQGLWALASAASRANAGAVFRGNHFHDGYARVMVWKSSHGQIVNNRFERAGGVILSAAADSQHWLEGPLSIRDVELSGNTLCGCGARDEWLLVSEGTAFNITAANNTQDPSCW